MRIPRSRRVRKDRVRLRRVLRDNTQAVRRMVDRVKHRVKVLRVGIVLRAVIVVARSPVAAAMMVRRARSLKS